MNRALIWCKDKHAVSSAAKKFKDIVKIKLSKKILLAGVGPYQSADRFAGNQTWRVIGFRLCINIYRVNKVNNLKRMLTK